MQSDRPKIRKAQNSERRKIGVNENCGGRKIRKVQNQKASAFACGVLPLPMEGGTIRQTKNQKSTKLRESKNLSNEKCGDRKMLEARPPHHATHDPLDHHTSKKSPDQ